MSVGGQNIFTPQGPLIPASVAYASANIGKLSLGTVVNEYKTGTLTLAQVLNMYATPVEILPVLSPGFMYVVNKFVLESVYGTATYAAGGVIYLQYGAAVNGANTAPATGTIAAALLVSPTVSGIASATGVIGSSSGLATSVTNGANLTVTNLTQVFTGGTGGSAVYHVIYKVVPVA
jgi:hypothetical protein